MISEDFNSEYDFIELKSYLCVRYPKQCIEIWQRWVTYSRLIPMTRSMRTKKWMRQYGCVQVVEEECAHEALRPQWKQLMASLGRGDELVVAKFSNAVRDLRGLAALVELCRIKVVRLVSIHDKIDTLGELFPDTTAAQVLEMFGALPEEVAVLRKSSSHIMQLQQTIKPPVTKKAMSRAEREKTIVDMYNNGYSIDDIWEVSGFNSKSSIWRVLNKYGVYLNRGRTSGPRVKKQQDETK